MMVNYHRHSDTSNVILPDSVATMNDYCKRIKELGQDIVSSCEHGTSGQYRKLSLVAKEYGLKWRYVAEAYFVEDRNVALKDKTNCHIILAAKTEKGIGDLNEVLSEGFISGYYYRPRIDMSLLMSLDPNDVFITTACLAGVWAYGYQQDEDKVYKGYDFRKPDEMIRRLHDHFCDSMALEVQYHDVQKQKDINRHILTLYRKEGIPIIAGMDSHVILPGDESRRTDFLGSKHLVYTDEEGFYMDYPDEETAIQRFVKQGVLELPQILEAIETTNIFETFEDVEFDKGRKIPTLYPELTQAERNQKYLDLVHGKWDEYKKTIPEDMWATYEKEIQYETDTIVNSDSSDYFLDSYEFVKMYKERGGALTKTGRGCFTETAMITTNHGLKKISDVVIGDKVIDINGDWKSVTRTYSYEIEEPLIELQAISNKMFGFYPTCTLDHKILVKNGDTYEWTEAKHIKIGARLCVPKIYIPRRTTQLVDLSKYSSSKCCFDDLYVYEQDTNKAITLNMIEAAQKYGMSKSCAYNFIRGKTPIYTSHPIGRRFVEQKIKFMEDYGFTTQEEMADYYNEHIHKHVVRYIEKDELFYEFVGLMYGDGCVYNKGNKGYCIQLAINPTTHKNGRNKSVFYTMASRLNVDVIERKQKNKNLVELVFYCHSFGSFFASQYFSSQKGIEKKVPEELLELDCDKSQALFNGLMESDGNITQVDRHCFDNTSIELVNLFKVLCMKTGVMPPRLHARSARIDCRGYSCKESYKMTVPIYTTDSRLSRKFTSDDKYWLIPVTGIKVISKQRTTVYDIAVEGSHSFLLNNMIVHNSSPSFLTNMLLGLTSIDRLQMPITMYPDRFLSLDRLLAGSNPDIDLNLSDQRLAANCLKELFGEWNVLPAVAFGTMGKAAAWKMYCRAMNIDFELANSVSDKLKAYEKALKYAEEDERDSINIEDYIGQEYLPLYRSADAYIGIIDSISQHPCAHIICSNDIRREFGVFRIKSVKNGEPVYCAWIDGATADAFGYIKEDLLLVDTVRMADQIYKAIGMLQPSVPELMKMVENDKPTWDIYSKGLTLGINQCEKEKSTEKVMKYHPKNVSELSAFVAAIRPGFKSNLNQFLARKRFSYKIPQFDALIQTPEMPDSWILYQEQMMKTMQYAGFTAPESYAAIKAIAKKHPEKVLPLKDKFLTGFSERLEQAGVKPSLIPVNAAKVWQIMGDACGYGFNSCLTGDTVILRQRCNRSNKMLTIEEMFKTKQSRQWAKANGHKTLHDKYLRYGYGSAFSLCEDGRVRINHIVDIRDAGVREVYLVTTQSGRTVRCTDNHKFPVLGHNEMIPCSELSVGDELYVSAGCRRGDYVCWIGNNEGAVSTEAIVSIEPAGVEQVYDVEMEAPNHNFVLDNGLVVGNSHSVSVALDSLYVAYAKSHYPYETYSVLMQVYSEKGDKDKIDRARNEMKAFGIISARPRFGQDNRGYYVDKEAHTISENIASVKGIGQRTADDLYELGKKHFGCFVDLLADAVAISSINSGAVETLIHLNYFDEFGSPGKLMKIYHEFYDSKEHCYKKTYVEKTKKTRLDYLRQFEAECEDCEVSMADQLSYELRYLGTPTTLYPDAHCTYMILEVDDKYSPKIKMYNVATGNTGMMKMKKPQFKEDPLKLGDVIELLDWHKEQAWIYADGKARRDPLRTEFWIDTFKRCL